MLYRQQQRYAGDINAHRIFVCWHAIVNLTLSGLIFANLQLSAKSVQMQQVIRHTNFFPAPWHEHILLRSDANDDRKPPGWASIRRSHRPGIAILQVKKRAASRILELKLSSEHATRPLQFDMRRRSRSNLITSCLPAA